MFHDLQKRRISGTLQKSFVFGDSRHSARRSGQQGGWRTYEAPLPRLCARQPPRLFAGPKLRRALMKPTTCPKCQSQKGSRGRSRSPNGCCGRP